jgi:thioredoxin-like negative regulator of GroEL
MMKDIKKKADFDLELAAGGDRFVLFHSAWCPFCMAFAPAFAELAAGGKEAFAKVSVDSLPEMEDAFSVDVVPTVLFFRDGKLRRRLDGALGRGLSAGDLAAFVKLCKGKEKN